MTLRWGILGCGDVARRRVAEAIQREEHSRLRAACRRDEAKLKEFCATFGVEQAYARDEDLLADADIDAVYIATPVHLHLPQTLAAAAAGKHVLVEKPMALSAAECEEMVAGCRKHGVKLGVAYYRRFYPSVGRMKELIDSGAIGEPLSVSAVTSTPFAMKPGDDGYWRVLPEQGGGGALMDIGSHRIQLFLHLLGDVTAVKGFCSTVAASYAAEDAAGFVMSFKSGAQGVVQCFFGSRVDPDRFEVMGTGGRLVVEPLNGHELRIELGQERRTESQPPPANYNAPLVADFVGAVREDRDPAVSGEEGARVNEVLERAYADARGTSS